MSVHQVLVAGEGLGPELFAQVLREGSAAHAYLHGDALDRAREAPANIADLAHNLCLLHGRHPGMIDVAAERSHRSPVAAWLEEAAAAFGRERTLLAMLVAAAGPLPSTPGEAETSAAIITQRTALETLAASDRAGCTVGAVAALVLDWHAIRGLLDRAAERLGVTPTTCVLPGVDQTCEALRAVGTSAAPERAARFGAQQLLVQQAGFWSLLEARWEARHRS